MNRNQNVVTNGKMAVVSGSDTERVISFQHLTGKHSVKVKGDIEDWRVRLLHDRLSERKIRLLSCADIDGETFSAEVFVHGSESRKITVTTSKVSDRGARAVAEAIARWYKAMTP